METTMSDKATNRGKPKIVIGDVDHERLTSLATGALDRMPEVADILLSELERAKVVKAVPVDTIQMGSTIEYRPDDGQQRKVTLVFPGEADIAEGKVSILTPIGTALIGLSQGQSIDWTARDGRRHRLTIISVKQPATSES
jgi:regulator of nucleoside diphosphate kinase